MRVTTLTEHRNEFGDKWIKKTGDEYEVTPAVGGMLVGAGLVEKTKAAAAEPEEKP